VKERERLVSTIEQEVKMHSQIEEEVFYPAFLAATEKTDAEPPRTSGCGPNGPSMSSSATEPTTSNLVTGTFR
jgi:hypothetical protein